MPLSFRIVEMNFGIAPTFVPAGSIVQIGLLSRGVDTEALPAREETDPGCCRECLAPHPFVSTGDGQRCRWVGGRAIRCGCYSVNSSLISASNKQYPTTIIDEGLSRVLLYYILYKCFYFNASSQFTHPPTHPHTEFHPKQRGGGVRTT